MEKDYISETPPIFSSSPEFTPLTYSQRELLFDLIDASKKEAYQGEFQWCVETEPDNRPPLHFIVGLKPVSRENNGVFDFDNPVFEGKEWKMVIKLAQMKVLEEGGYVSISPLRKSIFDKNNKKEVWVNFCLNQKAYDYSRFMKMPKGRRFLHGLWMRSQKDFVTVVVSIISGVIGGILLNWLSSLNEK